MTTTGDAAARRGSSWEECAELLDRLPLLPMAARGEALERLLPNTSPGIRERALRLGAAILDDQALVDMLRDDADAVRRNAGLEILKIRGSRSYQVALGLLRDGESEVVLQAVLLLDHLRDPRALGPLRAALAHPDPNVVQGVIVALGRLGNAGSVPDLLPFLAADPWLQMAAVQALGDLRSARAVRPLANLLTDLVVGPMAAEAVARIGGALALRTLAAHWLCFGSQLDAAGMLGLLAHVLEGLPRPPADPPAGLLPSLAPHLASGAGEARAAAARCVLALGPSPWDARAVAALAEAAGEEVSAGAGGGAAGAGAVPAAGTVREERSPDDAEAATAQGPAPGHQERRAGWAATAEGPVELTAAGRLAWRAGGAGVAEGPVELPAALARRGDLAASLLAEPGYPRAWGLLMCARLGQAVPAEAFFAAVAAAASRPELLAACRQTLARLRHPGVGAAALDLYLALPVEARADVEPLLRRRRREVRAALAERSGLAAADRLVLAARLGEPAAKVAAALLALAPDERVAAALQLAGLRLVMRALPWQEWLREEPRRYAEAAAEAAGRSQLRELLPALRQLPAQAATPALLRAMGELGDRASVPVLLALAPARPELRLLALEALGRIGGPEARAALRAAARGSRGGEARAAYRALSQCAAEEDEALFRAAVTDPDWYVRLLCVEVLGRFARPENLNALARLAGDPMPSVAGRALALLEG
jgi:HEAT repeat protein